jgi:hypothetical protein
MSLRDGTAGRRALFVTGILRSKEAVYEVKRERIVTGDKFQMGKAVAASPLKPFRPLLLQHSVDEGIKLTAVNDLDERFAVSFVADDVKRGSVIEVDRLAHLLVGIH